MLRRGYIRCEWEVGTARALITDNERPPGEGGVQDRSRGRTSPVSAGVVL